MLTEYVLKRGFGKARIKEYFVVQVDGDTLGGIVAGPFESHHQGCDALEALRPMYNRPLRCIGGHLAGWQRCIVPKLAPAGDPPADLE